MRTWGVELEAAQVAGEVEVTIRLREVATSTSGSILFLRPHDFIPAPITIHALDWAHTCAASPRWPLRRSGAGAHEEWSGPHGATRRDPMLRRSSRPRAAGCALFGTARHAWRTPRTPRTPRTVSRRPRRLMSSGGHEGDGDGDVSHAPAAAPSVAQHAPSQATDDLMDDITIEEELDDGPADATLADRRYRHQRIHVLGPGHVGKFMTHAFLGIPERPQLSMICRSLRLATKWQAEGERIEIVTDGVSDVRSGFKVEYRDPDPQRDEDGADPRPRVDLDADARAPIRHLIVTTKAMDVAPALLAVKAQLLPSSTILFMQNGMGVVDEVNERVFPDPTSRPHYLVGVNTHGLGTSAVAFHEPQPASVEERMRAKIRRIYSTTHYGAGNIAVGLLPRAPVPAPDGPGKWVARGRAQSTRYLLRTLTRTPVLSASGYGPQEILKQQLEKLAVNAVINPLTTIYNCRNGALLYNRGVTQTMHGLLDETAAVCRALPELQGEEDLSARFTTRRLVPRVVDVAMRTKTNVSSMRQDVQRGRHTEIDYINGYIVRRAEALGLSCPLNRLLVDMVKARAIMDRAQLRSFVPTNGPQIRSVFPSE
ncbi:MAG: hypothetical protein M1838_000267 [Thelocarpon superellum]|nr:MAG: hypothetical protein M1838_000267 [Thelocarpon superellum]